MRTEQDVLDAHAAISRIKFLRAQAASLSHLRGTGDIALSDAWSIVKAVQCYSVTLEAVVKAVNGAIDDEIASCQAILARLGVEQPRIDQDGR